MSSSVMARLPPDAPESVPATAPGTVELVVVEAAVVVVVVAGGGVAVNALVNAQVTWGSAWVNVTRTSVEDGAELVPLQVMGRGAQVPSGVSGGPNSTIEYCPRSNEPRE